MNVWGLEVSLSNRFSCVAQHNKGIKGREFVRHIDFNFTTGHFRTYSSVVPVPEPGSMEGLHKTSSLEAHLTVLWIPYQVPLASRTNVLSVCLQMTYAYYMALCIAVFLSVVPAPEPGSMQPSCYIGLAWIPYQVQLASRTKEPIFYLSRTLSKEFSTHSE